MHLCMNVYVIHSMYCLFLPKWERWHTCGLTMCFLHTLTLLYKRLSISSKTFPARVWIRRAVATVRRGPDFPRCCRCRPKTARELVRDGVASANSFHLHAPSRASSLVIPIVQMSVPEARGRLAVRVHSPRLTQPREPLW